MNTILNPWENDFSYQKQLEIGTPKKVLLHKYAQNYLKFTDSSAKAHTFILVLPEAATLLNPLSLPFSKSKFWLNKKVLLHNEAQNNLKFMDSSAKAHTFILVLPEAATLLNPLSPPFSYHGVVKCPDGSVSGTGPLLCMRWNSKESFQNTRTLWVTEKGYNFLAQPQTFWCDIHIRIA